MIINDLLKDKKEFENQIEENNSEINSIEEMEIKSTGIARINEEDERNEKIEKLNKYNRMLENDIDRIKKEAKILIPVSRTEILSGVTKKRKEGKIKIDEKYEEFIKLIKDVNSGVMEEKVKSVKKYPDASYFIKKNSNQGLEFDDFKFKGLDGYGKPRIV